MLIHPYYYWKKSENYSLHIFSVIFIQLHKKWGVISTATGGRCSLNEELTDSLPECRMNQLRCLHIDIKRFSWGMGNIWKAKRSGTVRHPAQVTSGCVPPPRLGGVFHARDSCIRLLHSGIHSSPPRICDFQFPLVWELLVSVDYDFVSVNKSSLLATVLDSKCCGSLLSLPVGSPKRNLEIQIQ